jgi:hypothetical protein
MSGLLDLRLEPRRLRWYGLIWIAIALCVMAPYLWRETAVGLTDGRGYPFGEDFLNFWGGPRLASLGRVADVYDFSRFHAFQSHVVGGPILLHHYSYPPAMLLLSLPLAVLPYVAAWLVWTLGGWLGFASVVRTMWPGGRQMDAWLYAAATPAVMVNVMSGQSGAWTASLIGWGLLLLERSPLLGGGLLGVLAVKPQLAILLPIALLAGRHWRALGGFVVTAVVPALAAQALFGTATMWAFLTRMTYMRRAILEDGTGVWHRMTSVFVLVRHLPAPVWLAYAAQAVMTLACVTAVALVWRSAARQALKNAVLVSAMLLASPYMQDYDLVVGALIPLWLMSGAPEKRKQVLTASTFILAAPALVALLTVFSGFGVGCLMLVPVAWVALSLARESGAALELQAV